tara:strand:- start:82 stop:573 length:492 start_codon:yes stop_codon:yes gene_type:complete
MSNFDTLFLDRDGVINIKLDGQYIRNFSEFEFISGSLSAISKLTQLFCRIIIVTNQQGIGKGIMSESDLHSLHLKMQQKIEKFGGKINKIYYCPHLAASNCLCRKPKPGMIKNAILDFPQIVIKKSYLVGDSDSDIEAGKCMKLNTVKVDNSYTLEKWTLDLL